MSNLGSLAQREADAALVESAGCSGCSVHRPFVTRKMPAQQIEEHDPRCPIVLADRIRKSALQGDS